MVTFSSWFLYEPLQVTKWHKWFDSFSATGGIISTQIAIPLSKVYSHTNFVYEYMNSLRPDRASECIFRAFRGTNFESMPVRHQLWWCLCGFHMMCTPLSAGGWGLNLLPNFQKRGLDRSSTLRGRLLEKRRVTFFRGVCNIYKKIN